jgi:cytochrome P450
VAGVTVSGPALSDEWYERGFDYLAPEVAAELPAVLERMRTEHPVAWSEAYGGHWVVTRYDDVLAVAQDWETYSSAHGVSPRESTMSVVAIPEHIDPPLHRTYKRLINAHFTPAAVHRWEEPTRALVTRLIDGFVADGACEFMGAFARPLPGLAFFDLALGAPPDEVAHVNEMATAAANPTSGKVEESWAGMHAWIVDFVERRRSQPPRGDVVDAAIAAEIEGRPITDDEIIGIIQLLILGGLDTTAGALGQAMIRFARQPEIPAQLRERPDLVPAAVEELLRLDPPFIAIGRTAMRDAEIGGCPVHRGDKVLISWAAANRDPDEFECPAAFDAERRSNRHLSFGAGPHRCAGSTLARMNLRIAITELTARLGDIALADGSEPITFHSALSRSPDAVPITFTPASTTGRRSR